MSPTWGFTVPLISAVLVVDMNALDSTCDEGGFTGGWSATLLHLSLPLPRRKFEPPRPFTIGELSNLCQTPSGVDGREEVVIEEELLVVVIETS